MARLVFKKRMDTTEDQHHADEQINQWARIWNASVYNGEHVNVLFWKQREEGAVRKSQCADSNPPTGHNQTTNKHPPRFLQHVKMQQLKTSARHVAVEELQKFKRIIRTFSKTIAVAHDKLPPKIIKRFDDETLAELIELFRRCDEMGKWLAAWREATMVMIPKSEEFKWRVIAMLVTSYRVWAKAASEEASDWMRSLKREWIANGPKKTIGDRTRHGRARDRHCSHDGRSKKW